MKQFAAIAVLGIASATKVKKVDQITAYMTSPMETILAATRAGIRSQAGDPTPVAITLKNDTEFEIDLMWISFDGQEKIKVAQIPAGDSGPIHTGSGNAWYATPTGEPDRKLTVNGVEIWIAQAEHDGETIEIRDPGTSQNAEASGVCVDTDNGAKDTDNDGCSAYVGKY